MIPVILGVLIALFINNWKQQVDDEKFMIRIFDSIRKEMELNKNEFTEVLPKQYAIIDSIEIHISNEKISLADIIIKSNGLQVPTVKNTSWKSFLNSKLELIDFEVISKLTDIEEAKQFMNSKFNKLMDFVLNNAESTDSKSKKMLIIQILNLIDSEEGLLKMYKDYLEMESETSH